MAAGGMWYHVNGVHEDGCIAGTNGCFSGEKGYGFSSFFKSWFRASIFSIVCGKDIHLWKGRCWVFKVTS